MLDTFNDFVRSVPYSVLIIIIVLCFFGPTVYEKLELASLPEAEKTQRFEHQQQIEKQKETYKQNLDSFLSTPVSELESEYNVLWVVEHIKKFFRDVWTRNVALAACFIFIVIAGGFLFGFFSRD